MGGRVRRLAARMGVALALMAPPGCAAAARVPFCISGHASAEEARARAAISLERINSLWVKLSKKHETLLGELEALREEGLFGDMPIHSRFVFDVTLPNVESTLQHLKNAMERLRREMDGAGVAAIRGLAQEGCSLEFFAEVLAGHCNGLIERSFSEISAARKELEAGL